MEIQWPLVVYTLLSALGLGLFGVVALAEWLGKAERTRFPATITALVALTLGGLASLFHLGHPERIFNALTNLGSSLAQEMIVMGLTGLAMLVYLVLLWRGYRAQGRRIVAMIALVLAVLLAVIIGTTYVMPSRPAWNTWLVPVLYMASAAVLGLFTMYIWAVVRKEDASSVMGVNQATLWAVVVQALGMVAYVVYLAMAREASPAGLLSGDLAVTFWVGVVLVGLVIPFLLTAWVRASSKRAMPALTVATIGLVCVLGGGIATRAVLFLLGGRVSLF